MIAWFARNDIAANLLLVGIFLAGIYCAFNKIPLEVKPAREHRTIMCRVDYPGATVGDLVQTIVIPIEEALEGLEGVKGTRVYVSNGYQRVWIDAEDSVNMHELVEEVKSRVDGISTFPSLSEPPTVEIWDSAHWYEVISIAVTGNLEEKELRKLGERIRLDLLNIDGISRVNLMGQREYEIAIEADQERLAAFGLGFSDVANAIRRSSINLPAGSIDTESGTLTVRTRGQAYDKDQFDAIPIRAANGAELMLGDVVKVTDGFEEGKVFAYFNGKPALNIEVVRSGKENAIEISDKVRAYVSDAENKFPNGIELFAWKDDSLAIRGRLGSLTNSLLQGSVLVLLVLGLFLRPSVAFWVVIGVPISFAGGLIFMPYFGITANVMSLFAFVIVLGLVVDDAIVTAENIFAKRQAGMDPEEASITGAQEVAVPVTFGVITTIVAFLPLLSFEGAWGDFANQIPYVVAPVLVFSLIESKLILPSHLKHVRVLAKPKPGLISRLQMRVADGLEWWVDHVYQPTLIFSLAHRYSVICGFFAMGLLLIGYCQGGRLGFVSTPTVDMATVGAYLDLHNDVDYEETIAKTTKIEGAVVKLKEEFVDPGTGESVITNVLKVTGQKYLGYGGFDKDEGSVTIEVIPPSQRTEPGPRNSDIAKRWTELVGDFPEARRFSIRGEQKGTGYYDSDEEEEAIEIELRGPGSNAKSDLAEAMADLLEDYEGIAEAYADVRRGQGQLEIRIRPRAVELGLTLKLLAQQIRQAFYGEQAQRVQRDIDDIKVMVRLPRESRETLYTFEQMKVRTPGGATVPLTTVADIGFIEVPSRITRYDGAEIIMVRAQPEDDTVDVIGIAKEIEPRLRALVDEVPNQSFRFSGHIAEHEASKRRTLIGAGALMFALYALLAIPFKSMVQPIYVLLAVPFGLIGALLGHLVMGIVPSYLSVFGMLALSGVVVNDSLVLVDYINRRQRSGASLIAAVKDAGRKRFRPIMLTSITTFVGLVPLLFDRSIQAQFLIPMAVSLGFGILFATLITLYLIPSALLVGEDVSVAWNRGREWFWRPFRKA
ncbi:MAG: multidrug efflux pump subunit AcrB [Verrucomicrobiales bacterium]